MCRLDLQIKKAGKGRQRHVYNLYLRQLHSINKKRLQISCNRFYLLFSLLSLIYSLKKSPAEYSAGENQSFKINYFVGAQTFAISLARKLESMDWKPLSPSTSHSSTDAIVPTTILFMMLESIALIAPSRLTSPTM